MALTVSISPSTVSITQGAQVGMSAQVRDADNNLITAGLTYAWTASRGSFVGDTNRASALYEADFTDAQDVIVDVECAVTLAAITDPTVSAPSLTALSELGITGIVANLYITSTGNASPEIYRMNVVGTADPNSDPDITSDLAINRIRWFGNTRRLSLNRAGAGAWEDWDNTNPDASIFAVAPDGTYIELPVIEADAVGSGFIRWDLDLNQDSDFIIAANNIDTGDTFLVGVGTSGSIGFPGDSGTGTASVTTTPIAPEASTLEIFSGNNQSAIVNRQLTDPLVVRVLDQYGNAFEGTSVTFSATPNDGGFTDTSVRTDANGQASTMFTLGSTVGDYIITASVTGLTSVTFTATAAMGGVPPMWSATLASAVDGGTSTTIDIAALVADATTIQLIDEGRDWVSFDGATLTITEAPILRDAKVFRFGFVARNAHGTRMARYQLTVNASRLVWMYSTLYFKPPVNVENGRAEVHDTSITVPEVVDNNLNTFTTEDDMDVNVADADGNATKIDAIGVITKNVDSYAFTPTGGVGTGFSDRSMPSTFKTKDGRSQSRSVYGFHWEFYPLPAQITATSCRLQFTGANIEVYQIYLLELLLEIPDRNFLEILPEKVARTNRLIAYPNGGVDVATVLGAGRWKWETQYVLLTGRGKVQTSAAAFKRWLVANRNIFHVQESARYPNRMHIATQTETQISEDAQEKIKNAKTAVPFVVSEQ